MNAKSRNESHRKLFLSGGTLDTLLWGEQEASRQFAEARKEKADAARSTLPDVSACPCGCDIQDGYCDDYIQDVALDIEMSEDLPF